MSLRLTDGSVVQQEEREEEPKGPGEDEEAGEGANRLAQEHHTREGQAFLVKMILTEREGKYQLVISPAMGGEAYVGLLVLIEARWEEGAVGSLVLDSCQRGTSKAEVRRVAEEAALKAGGPVVLAIRFATAVGDAWPRARPVEKLSPPVRPGMGSPSFSCILMGSGKGEPGQAWEPGQAKAPVQRETGAWMKKVTEGDAGLHLVIVGAAMTSCHPVAEDVRRICRVAECSEAVRDLAKAWAVSNYRGPLEVEVAELCGTYCPEGQASVVTPVFLKTLGEMAVRNTAGFIEELMGSSQVKASMRELDRGEVPRKREALVDSLSLFCRKRGDSAAVDKLFMSAFGVGFTLDRLYMTQVSEAAGNLGSLVAGIRALLVGQLVDTWASMEEMKRKIVREVAWKRGARSPPGQLGQGGGGRRGPGGKFQATEQVPPWVPRQQPWQGPQPMALAGQQQAVPGQGLAMGQTQPQRQGGRGGGRGEESRAGGRGTGPGEMRDVSKDVCVPSHLEPKVKLYNDRAYQGGGYFCVSLACTVRGAAGSRHAPGSTPRPRRPGSRF